MAYDPNNGFIYVANPGAGWPNGGSITAYDNNGNQQTLSGSFPGLTYPVNVLVVPASDGLALGSTIGVRTAYDDDAGRFALRAARDSELHPAEDRT